MRESADHTFPRTIGLGKRVWNRARYRPPLPTATTKNKRSRRAAAHLRPGVSLLQGPIDAAEKYLVQNLRRGRYDPLRADPHGYVIEQGLGQPLPNLPGGNVRALRQVGAHQPNSAVNVEPDASRTNDGVRIVHVESCDVPYAEPVPRVHVGHGQGSADYSGKGRNVGHLPEGGYESAPPPLPGRS